MSKPLRLWAAYVDGEMDYTICQFYAVRVASIHRTRREARAVAQDVRQVLVTEVPVKPKRGRT